MDNSNKKIKFLPLPYIGMYDLDLIYQTSDVEMLYQILAKVNEIAQSQNIIIDNFEKILDWAQNQIEKYTKEQLQKWLDDGTLESLINSVLFNSKISVYKTVQEMLNDTGLIENIVCRTLGFYNENDGGGATYIISTTGEETFDCLKTTNNLYAKLLDYDINVLKYGCKCDGVYDDAQVIRYCIQKAISTTKNVYIPSKTYHLKSTDTLHTNSIFWFNENHFNIYCEPETTFLVEVTSTTDYLFNINESEFPYIANLYIDGKNLIKNAIGNNENYCKYIKFDNIRIVNCDYGINLISFIGTLNNCLVRNCKVGYRIQPESNNIATAFIFENCGVYDNTEMGFDLYVVYSSLISCYCDNTPLPYNILGRGINMSGCGCEKSPKVLVSPSFRGFVINGFYCQNVGGSSGNESDYLFEFVSGTDCVISGLHFESCHDYNYKIGLTGNSYGYECITVTDLSARRNEVIQTQSNYFFGTNAIRILQDESTHKVVTYDITEDNVDNINSYISSLARTLSPGCYLVVNINTELNLTKPIYFYDFVGNPIIINVNAKINMNGGDYAIRFIRCSSVITINGNGNYIETSISNTNWRMIEFQYSSGGINNLKFKNNAVNGGSAVNSTNASIVKVSTNCTTEGTFGSGSLQDFNEDSTSLIFKR